jgi:hypothetical protein
VLFCKSTGICGIAQMQGCNETVSGGAGMTNAISVKDRLKKQVIEDGKHSLKRRKLLLRLNLKKQWHC